MRHFSSQSTLGHGPSICSSWLTLCPPCSPKMGYTLLTDMGKVWTFYCYQYMHG